ncbi:MAG: four helix bundle protein [Synergistaceae bacterium]|nr:four helix bundle protein [Candidatus Equadaptatus faecalis]
MNLEVWQDAMKLAKMTYSLIKMLPVEERFALADQMRRAAVSVPSNIAEGHSRHNDNEFLQFLRYAQGSRAELETQFRICADLGYLESDALKDVLALSDKTAKGIYKLSLKIADDIKNSKK